MFVVLIVVHFVVIVLLLVLPLAVVIVSYCAFALIVFILGVGGGILIFALELTSAPRFAITVLARNSRSTVVVVAPTAALVSTPFVADDVCGSNTLRRRSANVLEMNSTWLQNILNECCAMENHHVNLLHARHEPFLQR